MVRNIKPDTNTIANASAGVYPEPSTTVYVKNALSPIPGASAIGAFA